MDFLLARSEAFLHVYSNNNNTDNGLYPTSSNPTWLQLAARSLSYVYIHENMGECYFEPKVWVKQMGCIDTLPIFRHLL